MIPEEPKTLEFFHINSYAGISVRNVTEACAYYGIEETRAEPAIRIVSCVLGIGQSRIIAIPDGYQANMAVVIISPFAGPPALVLTGIIGTATFNNAADVQTLALNNQTASLPVEVNADSSSQQTADVILSIEITCSMTAFHEMKWQKELYARLQEAYEKKMIAYRAAMQE